MIEANGDEEWYSVAVSDYGGFLLEYAERVDSRRHRLMIDTEGTHVSLIVTPARLQDLAGFLSSSKAPPWYSYDPTLSTTVGMTYDAKFDERVWLTTTLGEGTVVQTSFTGTALAALRHGVFAVAAETQVALRS